MIVYAIQEIVIIVAVAIATHQTIELRKFRRSSSVLKSRFDPSTGSWFVLFGMSVGDYFGLVKLGPDGIQDWASEEEQITCGLIWQQEASEVLGQEVPPETVITDYSMRFDGSAETQGLSPEKDNQTIEEPNK